VTNTEQRAAFKRFYDMHFFKHFAAQPTNRRELAELAFAAGFNAAFASPPTTGGDVTLGEAVVAVVQAARDLVMKPGGLRNNGQALVVVEKADKSDPHYRLCSALERLDALSHGEGRA